MPTDPLISCLMVTRGALAPTRFAIDCFRRQTWQRRELVILSDSFSPALIAHVAALADPTIRLIEAAPAPLGTLRNAAIAAAHGEWLAHWDDDDLSHPRRLELQVEAMQRSGFSAIFLHRWTMWWPRRMMLAVSGRRPWEGSMLAARTLVGAYPPLALGEDSAMLEAMAAQHGGAIGLLDRPDLLCYVVHGRNSWSTRHFEELFARATQRWEFADYDRALARLTEYPIADYREMIEADAP